MSIRIEEFVPGTLKVYGNLTPYGKELLKLEGVSYNTKEDVWLVPSLYRPQLENILILGKGEVIAVEEETNVQACPLKPVLNLPIYQPKIGVTMQRICYDNVPLPSLGATVIVNTKDGGEKRLVVVELFGTKDKTIDAFFAKSYDDPSFQYGVLPASRLTLEEMEAIKSTNSSLFEIVRGRWQVRGLMKDHSVRFLNVLIPGEIVSIP